jgi:hypothetical protein
MHQNCSHRLSHRDRSRRLNGFELLETMHLLALAGEAVLTHVVALSL